jgi:hypothetical protein
MTILASQGEYAYAAMPMRPPVIVSGASDIEQTINGVAMSLPYMRIAASGYRWIAPTVNIAFNPLDMKGYGNAAPAGVELSFRPMTIEARDTPATTTPYFSIVLPAITGDQAEYVVEVATALDAITESTIFKVADGAAARDSLQIDESALIFDSALALDAIQHASSDFIADSATTGDALVLEDADFVSDGVSALDALALTSTLTDLVSDGATASESVEHGSFDLIADGASALDGIEHETAELIADGASALDALSFAGTSSDLIADGAVAGDDHVITGTSITLVEDGATARDAVFHKDPRAVAWVLNTESAAPCWYSNWQIDDMVQVGDQVFAVGPEGLLLIGADTDAGADIDASVQYGFSDFGTDQKKRVDAFWFGYTSTDVLEVSVETYGQGYPAYTYEMQPVLADQPRNNRIKPGKGLNARYWRVTLNNVGGCDFSVSDTAADLAASARRI